MADKPAILEVRDDDADAPGFHVCRIPNLALGECPIGMDGEEPMWMVGDSAYDTLDWHDPCGQQMVVPVAPYNPRNTDDPKHIEYRVKDRIKEHSEDVQLKQSTLDETYNRRTGVERTNESVKDCGLGRVFARGRVHARSQVFLALCLCLVVAITNYERGENQGSTIIRV